VPSWRERRQWRGDFQNPGVDNVRLMVRDSNFGEEKQRYAREWLRQQDQRPEHVRTAVMVAAPILAAVVATLLAWFLR
jgi:hypothetical protein